MAHFDALTQTYDCVDCISYMAASNKAKKGEDPDFPTYWQLLARPDYDEWREAMNDELETLKKLGTWTLVPRAAVEAAGHKIIKSTWAFRQKRSPDGTATKKKARFCVRGDHQKRVTEEVFESFAPVVQWSSVRLMLILSIVHNLETRQVDYVNAFAQSPLGEREVYIELPLGFKHKNECECVFKLHKSLYGMADSPKMFFDLLKSNRRAMGFKQFKEIDPCLFVHKKAIRHAL